MLMGNIAEKLMFVNVVAIIWMFQYVVSGVYHERLPHTNRAKPYQQSNLRLRGAGDSAEEGKLTYSLINMQKMALGELIGRVIPDNETACGPWKTLLFDHHWRDVFTMALKPSELQFYGVVNYQLIEESREDLPDFPAAYFLNCEETNATLLADIVNEDPCESHYFYASGPTPPNQWDGFCARVDPDLLFSRVRTISDIFADFISLGLALSAPFLSACAISFSH
jgi:hypothetical protein